MPNGKAYWKKRAEDNVKHADKATDAMLSKQKKLYQETYKKIEAHINDIYNEFLAKGEISTTKLYEYGKWANMQRDMQRKIRELGDTQLSMLNEHLEQMYREVLGSVSSELGKEIRWGTIQQANMDRVLNFNWSGKHYSQRLWGNTSDLAKRVQKAILDNVSLGASKDKLTAQLMNEFGKGYNEANRLARTETMYVVNQSQAESYKEAGVTQYEFLAELDEHTSEDCSDLNGDVFSFDDAVVGENYPPMHPNCRSTIIPVTTLDT